MALIFQSGSNCSERQFNSQDRVFVITGGAANSRVAPSCGPFQPRRSISALLLSVLANLLPGNAARRSSDRTQQRQHRPGFDCLVRHPALLCTELLARASQDHLPSEINSPHALSEQSGCPRCLLGGSTDADEVH